MIFSRNQADKPIWVSDAKMAFWEAFYCVGTVVVTTAVLWWFMPLWLTTLMVAVVFFHEMGHYFTAIANGQAAHMPFFIPLVYAILGGTHVKGEDPFAGIKVAKAGPIVGALVAAVIAVAALLVGFMPAFWAASWMIVFQGYSGTFGSDGRKRKRFKRAILEYQAVLQGQPVPA